MNPIPGFKDQYLNHPGDRQQLETPALKISYGVFLEVETEGFQSEWAEKQPQR